MTYDRFFNLSKTQETPHSSSMGYGMSFVSSKSDLWSANATAVLWVMIYWTTLLQHRKPGIIADKDLSRYCIYPYTQSIPLLMTWRHNKHGLDIFSWDLPVSGLLYSCMKSSDVTKYEMHARHAMASLYLTFRNTSLIILGTPAIRLSFPRRRFSNVDKFSHVHKFSNGRTQIYWRCKVVFQMARISKSDNDIIFELVCWHS